MSVQFVYAFQKYLLHIYYYSTVTSKTLVEDPRTYRIMIIITTPRQLSVSLGLPFTTLSVLLLRDENVDIYLR